MVLDEIDLQILDMLQESSRVSNAEIARTVGLTPPTALERIRKLERNGVLRGFHADLDPDALGCSTLAFLFIKTSEGPGCECASKTIANFPQVQELHHVAGDDCYLAKVRVASPKALGRFLRDELGQIAEVVSTRSTVVLETVKEDPKLPFPKALNAEP